MTSELRQHEREALSALFDGELKGDAARFALKRLEHDGEWRDAVERWQVAGDALRGCASALLPADFSTRVAAAIAADPASAPARYRRPSVGWLGGTALAASLAALVVFMAQRTPGDQMAPEGAAVVVAPPPVSEPPSQRSEPMAPAPASSVGPAVAVTEPARKTPVAERISTVRGRPVAPATPAAAVASASVSPTPSDPFIPSEPPVSRPWPRAVLPQYGSGQAVTAGFGTARSLHPFEPHMPEDTPAIDVEEPSAD